MRTIEYASAFKRDFKRVKAAPQHGKDIDGRWTAALTLLAANKPLPASNCDHALVGDSAGYRECHIKPDLLLIYRLPEPGKADVRSSAASDRQANRRHRADA